MPESRLLGDPTLDEIRAELAPIIAGNAAFDGWTPAAVAAAADSAGVDSDIAQLAFPDGPVDLIDAWFAQIDAAMVAAVGERLPALKVREKIAALVEARLDLLAPDRESLRRALATLAMPQHILRGAKLGWRAADAMWRAAGDSATDYNHYTKRTLLGGIYAATITVFLDDESAGQADTRAFLHRRIDDIMRFEKAKAGWLKRSENRLSLSRFIGRLRYPAV
ncbi:MAG: COQ9 family protein [Pseudomonadota bacterium]